MAISLLQRGGGLAIKRPPLPLPFDFDGLILAIGSDRLSAMLFDLMRAEFAIEHAVIMQKRAIDPVQVLFATDAHNSAVATDLPKSYASGYHSRDPLLNALGPARDKELLVCSLAVSDIADVGYRSHFYIQHDFAGKISIISRTPQNLLYLNFYRRRRSGTFRDDDLWKLHACSHHIAAIAEKHFSLAAPTTCSVDTVIDKLRCIAASVKLSTRELDTCARIALGYSTKRIARELKNSTNSVVSYRRRAFAKLNISNHKELYALLLANHHRIR